MGRLKNSVRIVTNERPIHAGKILIFCEGSTEFNYFEYLNNYLKNNVKSRYSELVIEQIETIDTKGNAQNVFNYAETFLGTNDNARKYSLYEKHLVFDCDDPKDIQSVIQQMKDSVNDYILDYTCLLFETWLVMHFMHLRVTDNVKKLAIISYMREHLGISRYKSKIKAAPGTENDCAYDIDVKEMNPSTNVHLLVEVILDEIQTICK